MQHRLHRLFTAMVTALGVMTLGTGAAQAQLPGTDRFSTPARIDAETLQKALKPAPPTRPTRNALIVILENGGLVNNLDPALRAKLNVRLPMAKCGAFTFEMRSGESIPTLLGRVANAISTTPQCLAPWNWRIETFVLADFVNERTDRMLQDTIKGSQSILRTQSRYDRYVVMEDANATPERVLAKIRELAPDYVLDIHVLTHGGDGFFVGYNGAYFNQASFFQKLLDDKAANKPLFIRAVYQMNCRGGSLKSSWDRLGAEAVNGTVGNELNSMPWQYFHFMGNWIVDRDSFASSTQTAYDEAALYTRPVFTIIGMGGAVSDSRLTISPNTRGTIRVN